jgi:transcriptional pleiotropic regulator of transition state genes
MDNIGRSVPMKTTGIVRQVDSLGRIVLPIELRRTLDIAERDSLEIYVEEDRIVLKKFAPSCIFCGRTEELVDFKGKKVCKPCITAMKKR